MSRVFIKVDNTITYVAEVRSAIVWCTMLCHAISSHAMSRHVMLCRAMSCHAVLCHVIVCSAMLVCECIYGERGSAPKRGRHSTVSIPPNTSAQWQPDGWTIHTNKWFLGARFLGAPPISLMRCDLIDISCYVMLCHVMSCHVMSCRVMSCYCMCRYACM